MFLKNWVACVASVSNRVIARKLEREQKKKKFNPAGETSHNFIKCRFSGQNPTAVISGTWLPGYPSIKSVKTISAVQGADMIQGPVVLSPSYSTYQ